MSHRLEEWLSKPFAGVLLAASLLAAIYIFIGKFVAQTVVDITQHILMGIWYYDIITGYASQYIDAGSFAGSLLIGEYGLLTMVPIYLLGLLLPLVFSFYLVLIFLQDSGLLRYISRMAERSLRYIGLSGEGVIPVLLGFGCVTAALISVNSLSSKRERLIVSILLCIAVPCSAQFAIILAVASALPLPYLLIYSLMILIVFICSGIVLNRLIPGETSCSKSRPVPPVLPSLLAVISKTLRASRAFLIDATPTFALGAILMAALNYTGGFLKLHKWCSPITSGLLKLPERATDLFMLAIIKKDLGAAELYSAVTQNSFTDIELTVILVVMTLFVPCFASLMVLFKDQGPWVAVLTWIGSFLLSFIAGAAVSGFFRFVFSA